MRLNIQISKMLVQLWQMLLHQVFQLEKPQVQRLKIGLVNLTHLIPIHDLHKQVEGLLLRHMQQERRDQKRQALTISHLFVIDGIGLAQLVQSLLPVLVLKELVAREGAINVPHNNVLGRRIFGQKQPIRLVHTLLILITSGQQLPHFASQRFRNAFANKSLQSIGPLIPRVPPPPRQQVTPVQQLLFATLLRDQTCEFVICILVIKTRIEISVNIY